MTGCGRSSSGEGDSFVVAFGRAIDAVACALELQRASLGPIGLRIGVHTGEAQLRDEANYRPDLPRTARLRDLAHGGQTVLSSTTSELVVDQLPAGAWLTDLGTHLRDLPRPERVMQLCHTESATISRHSARPNPFGRIIFQRSSRASLVATPKWLRSAKSSRTTGGHADRRRRCRQDPARRGSRGPSGQASSTDGVWYVDLAPITDPRVVPATVAHTLGIPDQPGRSTMDTLCRFVGDRHTVGSRQLRAPARRVRHTDRRAARCLSAVDDSDDEP